jgi:BirA family biotin operon repressor/biotin-[acetyl-CoA-carboxylase] ligase
VPSRNHIVAALLEHWVPAMTQFDRHGLPPFLERYARLDVLVGRAISLHGEHGVREADALGIADDGALRLRIDGREQRIHSGDVSVRSA